MPSFWLEHEENGQTRDFSFQSKTVSIGRDKASDFVLDHPTVSRKHAVIAYKHGSFYLVILSRSGLTAIDGKPVQGEVLLYDSSNLHVGQLEFRFRSNDAPVKPATPAYGSALPASGSFNAPGQIGFGGPTNTPAPQIGFGAAPMSQQQGLEQPQGLGGFGEPISPSLSQSGPASPLGMTGPSLPSSSGDLKAEKTGGDAGASWDQIANSSEAMLDASGAKPRTIHERIQGSKAEEKTNPAIVVIAGLAILGLMYFSFFNDGGVNEADLVEETPLLDQNPVEIRVSCLGESACVQKAQRAYKVGSEKILQKTVAIPNLFEGYKKLLEAEAYLAKAGDVTPPASMDGLTAKKEATRAELNTIWTNYRVGFAKARKRNEYREMARQLSALRDYFPDRTARENRWSVKQAQKMKEDGIYPKRY